MTSGIQILRAHLAGRKSIRTLRCPLRRAACCATSFRTIPNEHESYTVSVGDESNTIPDIDDSSHIPYEDGLIELVTTENVEMARY